MCLFLAFRFLLKGLRPVVMWILKMKHANDRKGAEYMLKIIGQFAGLCQYLTRSNDENDFHVDSQLLRSWKT